MIEFEHKIDDYVMCKDDVCKIVDIKKMEFSGIDERMYYLVEPVGEQRARIYVPVDMKDADATIRKVLSVDEVKSIIERSENLELSWVEDGKERVNRFDKILQNGDMAEILWMFNILKERRKELEDEGKKLYVGDTRIFETAEKMITEEFAFVLGIKKDEVESYILEHLAS
ncbi:MAG TPA: CarD family transcriptional regulator [Oscillospiraceae bacterium]|nr:CarD family transcriptional regulator [Oscillospiraceae bacterium]